MHWRIIIYIIIIYILDNISNKTQNIIVLRRKNIPEPNQMKMMLRKVTIQLNMVNKGHLPLKLQTLVCKGHHSE